MWHICRLVVVVVTVRASHLPVPALLPLSQFIVVVIVGIARVVENQRGREGAVTWQSLGSLGSDVAVGNRRGGANGHEQVRMGGNRCKRVGIGANGRELVQMGVNRREWAGLGTNGQ